MPKILGPICDVIFFSAIKNKKYRFCSTKLRTVAFRSKYLSHYFNLNSAPPLNLKSESEFIPALNFLRSKDGNSECSEKLGFRPLDYLHFYKILFVSKRNSVLCDMANLFASTLSNRKFIGYSMIEQQATTFNPHLQKIVDELGYSNGHMLCNHLKEYKINEEINFDYAVNLCEDSSEEMPALPNDSVKLINWNVEFLSQKDLNNQLDFEEAMSIVHLKILEMISLPNDKISLDSIATALNAPN
jgi:protein-tyrosine-phosphatase